MTLSELGDLIRGKSFQDWPTNVKTAAKAILAGDRGFTEAQRAWFSGWWMVCTAADVDAINAALPAGTRVSALEVGGTLYLNGDLTTDCMDPGSTYYPARAVFRKLVWVEMIPPAQQGTP